MINPYGAMGAMPATQGESSDFDKYMKNLRDSGYDPKKDYTAVGTVRVQ